jgi:GNAT superfamily N-acetyltransferase
MYVASITLAAYAAQMQVQVRRATAADAETVHDVVLRAVLETNARDYPRSIIERLASSLPKRIASNLGQSHAFGATVDGQIVGTGSLDGQTVSSVFVHPTYQGQGIGARLMDAIEGAAHNQHGSALTLQSSITAQAFYEKRGFKVVRESLYGEERTIHMSKDVQSSTG